MDFEKNVTFISDRGLGGNYEMKLYKDEKGIFVISEMSGNKVYVKWIEEGKTVTYID
ncbi:hypothetical protein D3C76_1423090 [compost metagenome]